MPSLLKRTLLCGLLAITIEFVSANLHGRFNHREESIQHQFAILSGAPHVFEGTKYDEPYFQARIMFPLLLAGASKLGILSTGQWYLVLRIFSAFLMLMVLYRVLLAGSSDESVAISTMAYFSLAMIATFNFGWELSMDFFDAMPPWSPARPKLPSGPSPSPLYWRASIANRPYSPGCCGWSAMASGDGNWPARRWRAACCYRHPATC
jgi:hypothetical protein